MSSPFSGSTQWFLFIELPARCLSFSLCAGCVCAMLRFYRPSQVRFFHLISVSGALSPAFHRSTPIDTQYFFSQDSLLAPMLPLVFSSPRTIRCLPLKSPLSALSSFFPMSGFSPCAIVVCALFFRCRLVQYCARQQFLVSFLSPLPL